MSENDIEQTEKVSGGKNEQLLGYLESFQGQKVEAELQPCLDLEKTLLDLLDSPLVGPLYFQVPKNFAFGSIQPLWPSVILAAHSLGESLQIASLRRGYWNSGYTQNRRVFENKV